MSKTNVRLNYSLNAVPLLIEESITIPVSSLYRLQEIPNNITLYSPLYPNPVIYNFTEVTGVNPTTHQFRVDYAKGFITFSTADVGLIVNITYYGIGTSWLAEDGIDTIMRQLTLNPVEDNIVIVAPDGNNAIDSGKTFSTDIALGTSDDLISTQKAIRTNILEPNITDFTYAPHNHSNASQGGALSTIVPFPTLVTTITDFGNVLDSNYEQNTTVGQHFKVDMANDKKITYDAFSTTGVPLNDYCIGGGFGVANCSVQAGGTDGGGTYPDVNYFNGSTWRTGTAMNGPNETSGCGTFYGGLSGGNDAGYTEKFNGNSWSNYPACIGGSHINFVGKMNDALAFSWYYLILGQANTLRFNGATWYYINYLNHRKTDATGFGKANSAIEAGGFDSGADETSLAYSEYCNGLYWTVTANLLNALSGGNGTGTFYNGGIIDGQNNSSVYFTYIQKFNGLIYSVGADAIQERTYGGRAGTGSSFTIWNGYKGAGVYSQTAEKYLGTIPFTLDSYLIGETYFRKATDEFFTEAEKTDIQMISNADINTGVSNIDRADIVDMDLLDYVDDGVWSLTGQSMNTPSMNLAGSGIMNNALSIGGYDGVVNQECELFDGATWNNKAVYPIDAKWLMAFGKASATIAMGGVDGSDTILNTSYLFNGTSWSAPSAMLFTLAYSGAFGIQNSGVVTGGTDNYGAYGGSASNKTIVLDGNTWSLSGILNQSREYFGACGKRYSGFVATGGCTDYMSSAIYSSSEKFNGSVWSISSNILSDRMYLSMTGETNNALLFGGYIITGPSYYSDSFKFNGNNWYVAGNMNSNTYSHAGAGVGNAIISIGGVSDGVPNYITDTEKYTSAKSSIPNMMFDLKYTMVQ